MRKTGNLPGANMNDSEYAEKLLASQNRWWKRLLNVQWPYRAFLKSLHLGLTLDVGCGVGRNLKNLGSNVVGVDTDETAIRIAKERGFDAFTVPDFERSKWAREGLFDSLLFSHVLEHMEREAATETVKFYLPFLRKQGKVVLITPQERGFKADPTHKTFMRFADLVEIFEALKLTVERKHAFPFPHFAGRFFTYNEFVVTGRKLS
jgi:2-polyprenyl-3-methyl-5-hydroxy-6-metoxy-1,4-benzoquinol methylase